MHNYLQNDSIKQLILTKNIRINLQIFSYITPLIEPQHQSNNYQSSTNSLENYFTMIDFYCNFSLNAHGHIVIK